MVKRFLRRLLLASLAASLAFAQPEGGPAPAPPADALPAVLESNATWTEDASGRAALFEIVARRVEESYWNPDHLDWSAWRDRHRSAVVAAEGRAELDRAFIRMFEDLDDGHSRWLGLDAPPEGAGTSRSRGREAQVARPRLGADVRPIDGRGLLLVRVHPGGAAEAAGLLRGDVITAVGDEPLTAPGIGWGMRGAIHSALGRGEATLEVDRAAARFTATVEPRALPPGAAERPLVELDEDLGSARLEIPTFAAGTAEIVHAHLSRLREEGVSHLVVDVRGNPGGSVAEMGLVLGAFAEGTLLQARGREGTAWSLRVRRGDALDVRLVRSGDRPAAADAASVRLASFVRWDGEIAVLVDEHTASAAEAFAGALVRGADAVAVGTPTPGNVETIRRTALPGGHAAMIAVGDLRLPGGEPVAPVPLTVTARLRALELARGLDAPYAEAIRRLRDLPWTPGRLF